MGEKSVLIICDLFPPAFGPRMGYLCKYLIQNGWNPVVITEFVEDDLFSFLGKNVDVTYIRYYRKNGLAGKLEWGWTFLRDVLFGYKDKRMYREALNSMKKHHFDLVLCSTYRTYPMRAAWLFAEKMRIPLIVDLRDIIEQYTGNEFISHNLPKICGLDKIIASDFRKRNLRIRNGILRKAAAVTTVSPWHVSVLKKYNANTHLIYNGYDPEIFYPSEIEADKFYITYTGRLLSTAMRDPDLLFQAVEKLSGEGLISPDLFRIRWFVDSKSEKIINIAAGKYPVIEPYMEYPGYISAPKVPGVLNESSMLLLLTNKADAGGPKGVMTTKFFESLAVGKPILCVRGDEGCLEEVINRTRSGLSAHNAGEVYEFIKEHYLLWKEKKTYIDNSDKEEIKKFSREAQAGQFIQIFEQVKSSVMHIESNH
ncbi:MAG: glycosyltransferase [Tannerella sp.]|nr:glycosyltransferase [Tannerella sp.]